MRSDAPLPVRKAIQVAAAPDRAFAIFTSSMHRWWPGSLIKEGKRETVVVEPRAGGRWFERAVNGTEYEWGSVLLWEPPRRVVFCWQIDMDHSFDPKLYTEVEIRFDPVEKDATLVSLEHRNLENYGLRAEEAVEKFQGPFAWVGVLKAFETYNTSPPDFPRSLTVPNAPELGV